MAKSDVNIRDLRAKPTRNVFDLSKRIESSAPFGMLIPTFVKHVIPGSKFEISLENQTTARPLVTRAFARIREHFDYFFIPISQLYKPFENFITMQGNYHSKALVDVIGASVAPPFVPFVNGQSIQSLWATGRTDLDVAGYPMYLGNQRIAEYLGYGLYDYNRNFANFPRALRFNLFNALAYQKVYADFYRNDYYEGYYTDHFNIDDLVGDVSLNGSTPINGNRLYKIFEPHYRMKKKDYFTIVTPDILPNPAVAAFAAWNGLVDYNKLSSDGDFVPFNIPGNRGQNNQTSNVFQNQSSDPLSTSDVVFGSDVAFRPTQNQFQSQSFHKFAAAREAYLKRVFAARNNYSSEMAAIFGYSPETQRTDRVYHLGGFSQALSIDGINNTSQSGQNAELPTGQVNFYLNQQKKLHFTCKEHGILMCIYSTSCENDYRPNRVVRDNVRNYPEDFYIPQYENIGKQALYQFEFDLHIDSTDTDYQKKVLGIKGFVPRYSDYKMSVDEVHGALATSAFDYFSVFKNDNDTLGIAFNVTDLIENPIYVKNLFAGGLYDGTPMSDHFLLNQYHKIKMIAPMQTISNF